MESFDEKLIVLYQEQRCLYDKKHRSYKDNVMKENIWKKIAHYVNSDVETCQNRIKTLRERYTREKKAMAENWKSGSKASSKEPWPLMPMLEFLDEHIRGRRTYTNVAALAEVAQPNVLTPVDAQPSTSSSSNQCSTSYDGNSFDCVFEEELSLLRPESPPPQAEEPPVAVNLMETPASQRGKKRRHGTEDVIGENLRLIAEASSRFSQSLQSKRSSAEASFADFIVTQLSPLSEEIKDEAMVKIMQVLMDAKKKNRLLS